MTDLKLAAEFPPAARKDWLALVDKALRGAPFGRLESKTYDGLTIEPVYERASGANPIMGRAAAAPWQVMARVDHPDPASANKQALEDLENGATGLSLVFAGSVSSYGYGVGIDEASLDRILKGVHLDAGISIECELS